MVKHISKAEISATIEGHDIKADGNTFPKRKVERTMLMGDNLLKLRGQGVRYAA